MLQRSRAAGKLLRSTRSFAFDASGEVLSREGDDNDVAASVNTPFTHSSLSTLLLP